MNQIAMVIKGGTWSVPLFSRLNNKDFQSCHTFIEELIHDKNNLETISSLR